MRKAAKKVRAFLVRSRNGAFAVGEKSYGRSPKRTKEFDYIRLASGLRKVVKFILCGASLWIIVGNEKIGENWQPDETEEIGFDNHFNCWKDHCEYFSANQCEKM